MNDYTALVVEDSPTMRQLLVSALGQMGELKILEAEDGVDGLKQMREHQIDILITDINMPMMDGLKLVGMVRKDPKHRDIPIIIVTTEGAREDRDRGLSLGADAYLVKPVKPSEVVATVGDLLGLYT
ncbi:MAG: response regulator [Deltaproteobacteria bacterium]|jgi:two-component system chemotaxis response regulator CheY|nr:response regulator [Deltaproteobacteria bacterium]MBT6433530.1 response regulator [Deltaproteobacteria bacterium]MBT6489483.1 response regulator [Deltaproteobacteria bacterium]